MDVQHTCFLSLLFLKTIYLCRFSDTDVAWMCTQNAAVAAQFGRKDLTHVWSLASLLAIPALTSSDEQFHTESLETPWAQNPFGRKLLHAMHAFLESKDLNHCATINFHIFYSIEHYVKQYDIQTVAMLCCAFGNKNDNQEMSRRKKRSESGSVCIYYCLIRLHSKSSFYQTF